MPVALAEYPVYAPINPSFVGGDPLVGAYLLNKAQITNEYDPPSSGSGGTIFTSPAPATPSVDTDRIAERIDELIDSITESIDSTLGGVGDSLGSAISQGGSAGVAPIQIAPVNLNVQGGQGNTQLAQ